MPTPPHVVAILGKLPLAPQQFPASNALATDMKFNALCDFFDKTKAAKQGKRREILMKFLARSVTGARFDLDGNCIAGGADITTPPDKLGDVFQLFRLMLPDHDNVRVPYRLKEDALARALLVAFQVDPATAKGKDVKNWRHQALEPGAALGEVADGGGGGGGGRGRGRGGGGPRFGARSTAGQLAARVKASLFDTECSDANKTNLTIAQVNAKLDALAAASGAEAKGLVLRDLIMRNSSARNGFYLVQIILMRLKAGVVDTHVKMAWHPAAVALWNTTSSLKRVCDDLKDPRSGGPDSVRPIVELGAPAQPFLADAAPSAGRLSDATANVVADLDRLHALGRSGGLTAWPPEVARALRALGVDPASSSSFNPSAAPPFYIEKKIDGFRIQLHVEPGKVRFFTRSAIDHGSASSFSVLGLAVAAQVRAPRVVLDGELTVWRLSRQAEEPFNLLRPAWSAAGDATLGMAASHFLSSEDTGSAMTADPRWSPPALADLVLIYAPFDVLYLDSAGGSTIHLPLPARKALLAAVVARLPPGQVGVEVGVPHAPVPGGDGRTRMLGRIEPYLAGEPFMCDAAGVPNPVPACLPGFTPADIAAAYKAADDRGEEGIVVKGSAAPWKPGSRDLSWAKMKPEYEKKYEVDALVVGANYGTGHRGGVASEYICALLDEKAPARDPVTGHLAAGAPPPRFATFVRVGTGFTVEQRERFSALLDTLYEPARPGGPDGGGTQGGQGGGPAAGRYFPPWLRVAGGGAGTASEVADRWVANPADPRVPVLALKADVRVTQTRSYAVGLGLRHVRIARWHTEKAWADVPVAADFLDYVKKHKGKLGKKGGERVGVGVAGAARPAARPRGTVPEHLRPVAGVVTAADGPLAGKSVHVIDRLWGPHYQSAAACQAAVASLGGRWVAALTPTSLVDFVLADDPSRSGTDAVGAALYRAATHGGRKGPARDVLDVAWLAECEAAAAEAAARDGGEMEMDGEHAPAAAPPLLVAPAPRHYLHLARAKGGARAAGDIAAESHALPSPDRWGDPRTQPSTPSDMRAVLGRFMAGVALTRRDVLGPDALSGDSIIAPGTPDADEGVAAGLAALSDAWPLDVAPLPDTGLRGVAAAAVCLPRLAAGSLAPPAYAPALAHTAWRAAVAAEARADGLARRAAETGVTARGGRCVGGAAAWGGAAGDAPLSACPLTHLLVVPPPGVPDDAWPDAPSAVLGAVWAAGGAAGLARLRAGLASGVLRVVGSDWPAVGQAGEAALSHPFPGLPPAGSDAGWPWDGFGVAPVPGAGGAAAPPVLGFVGPVGGGRRGGGGGGAGRRRGAGAAGAAAPARRRRVSPPQPSAATPVTDPARGGRAPSSATTLTDSARPPPLPPGSNVFSGLLPELASQSGQGRSGSQGAAAPAAAAVPPPPPPVLQPAVDAPLPPPPAPVLQPAVAAGAPPPPPSPPHVLPVLAGLPPSSTYPDGAFANGFPDGSGWNLAAFLALTPEERRRLKP